MKYFITLLSLVLILSCSQNNNSNNSNGATDKNNFDWLLGEWQRTNDKPGKTTYEYWEKKSDKEYIGFDYVLEEKDTVFKENIRLIPIEGVWNFEVTGSDGELVLFAVTAQNKTSFACENAENEFPKKIEYALTNNKLEANISGGAPDISFSFDRLKK